MKKVIVVASIVAVLLSGFLVICKIKGREYWNKAIAITLEECKDEDERAEMARRCDYAWRLRDNPKELAAFLLSTGDLGCFVVVDEADHYGTVERAAELFAKDRSIEYEARTKAYEMLGIINENERINLIGQK